MPEDSNPQVEIIGAATAPRLSEEGIAYQKGLLADAKWCEEFPAHAAALRASLDNALAATGQDREPPPDERSAAQRLHDQRMGVTPRTADQYSDVPPDYRDFAAALSLPPDLARVVVNDALSGDKKADAAAMLGDRYEDTLKAAGLALSRAAHLPAAARIKASDLSAFALAQLAIWGKHLTRHASSRPKS